MTHRISNAKPRAVISTPWWIRLALYVVVGIVGLALTAFGIVNPGMVDSWLAGTGSVAAMLGGFFAAAHTGKASDETPAQEVARETAIQVGETPAGDGFSSYVSVSQ